MPLPHLRPFQNSEIVFVTTCVNERRPLLADAETPQIIREIWTKSGELNGWFVGQYVLMPDHLHLFACPTDAAIPLSRWMQLWKATTAKQINRLSRASGTFWQPDYFDRYI